MDESQHNPLQDNQSDVKQRYDQLNMDFKKNQADIRQQYNQPNVKQEAEIKQFFDNSNVQNKASEPGIIEKIGQKLNGVLTIKGQGLKSYIDDIKLAYEMLKDPSFQMSKNIKITLAIAMLYLISPIDLIPDTIPILGLLDDTLVVGFAIKQTATELERYRQHRSNQRTMQSER